MVRRVALCALGPVALLFLGAFACPTLDFAKQAAEAPIIFSGKVVSPSTKKGSDRKVARFEVIRVYKGRLSTGRSVAVQDCIGPKCGPWYKSGRRYILFARRYAGKIWGPDSCSVALDWGECGSAHCHQRLAAVIPGLYQALPTLAKSRPLIPGTTIPRTARNHALLAIVERYREAMIHRDTKALIALAHPRYYEGSGTGSRQDDYGYSGLVRILEQRLKLLEAVKLRLRYERIRVKGGVAKVTYQAHGSFKLGGRWRHHRDRAEMALRQHRGAWRISSGM